MIDFIFGESDFTADDKAIWEKLIKTKLSEVILFLRKLVHDKEVAVDLAGEALKNLWETRHNLTSEENAKAALFVYARNLAYNHYKKQASDRNKVAKLPLSTIEGPGNFEIFTRSQLISKVFAEIDRLPPRCREVMLLMYRDGKSAEEIGGLLEIAISTVWNQKKNGIDKLKEVFKGYHEFLDLESFLGCLFIHLIVNS